MSSIFTARKQSNVVELRASQASIGDVPTTKLVMTEDQASISNEKNENTALGASSYSSFRQSPSLFEVSHTHGSLRSITQSIARNQQPNQIIEATRFLRKEIIEKKPPIDVDAKVKETINKLDQKALKRIQLMRKGSAEKQNAYPCIFMKNKRLPADKSVRLQTLSDSNQHGIWVKFSDINKVAPINNSHRFS